MTRRLHPEIEELARLGALGPLDVHFAYTLARLVDCWNREVLLGAAAASRALAAGHICVELAALAGRPIVGEDGEPIGDRCWPELDDWVDGLRRSGIVREPSPPPTPLVLDASNRLYLSRYHSYENRLATAIARRVTQADLPTDPDSLRDSLERLFPRPADGPTGFDWQRLAALMAVERNFCVISGGPGTGKTSTVVKVLALLQEQARAREDFPLRIVMAAPTGKAAARLVESIERGREGIDVDDVIRDSIPAEAATIHRRLGYRPDRPTQFRHNADNPLPADVVVVDEASMVDLALMAKLVDAVPGHSKLILLGDRDQLASVDAGAVLGDICHTGGERPGYSKPFEERVARVFGEPPPSVGSPSTRPGIWDGITQLTHSWRFGDESAIGKLAGAINTGDGDSVAALLTGASPSGDLVAQSGSVGESVSLIEVAQPADLNAVLAERSISGYRQFLEASTPEEALERFDGFRVLCAHREGLFGVRRINRVIERALVAEGLLETDEAYYRRRPIMITRNDYSLRLFNGDVGVVFGAPETAGNAQACFGTGPGQPARRLAPGRLPPHETVFAMTVHKSQGSEVDSLVLVLPNVISPVLTRELLYTAVTRARRKVTVLGTMRVIREAIGRRVRRTSGLRDALWAASQPPLSR